MSNFRIVASISIVSSLAGCALQPDINPNQTESPAAGPAGEYVTDNSDVAYFQTGGWERSTHSKQFYGDDYSFAPAGSGESVATWNLNLIKRFNVYTRWTSHNNRGTNVKYTIYYLDEQNHLVSDVVTVDQTQNGGAWFKLGTYRMSALTGRVTVNNDANGYVVADAVLFEEVAEQDKDEDGDGMNDSWEREHGLDPTNPEDASFDLDNDGLTNLDEFLLLTNPTKKDSDGDGMDDAFEVAFGLDPLKEDHRGDLDGDGFSNIEEYLAMTDPSDSKSLPASNAAVLSWTAPKQRENGESLAPSEIASYEIVYHRETKAKTITIDNDTPGFIRIGQGLVDSTSVAEYVGSDYLAMARGGGESAAEWDFSNLVPGTTYKIDANWTSASNRASDAVYQLMYVGDQGTFVTKEVEVNQQQNGGTWQELAEFVPGEGNLTVKVTNEANGYVIADAVRVRPEVAGTKTVSVNEPELTSYVLKDLPSGTWVFQIRAVDTENVKSGLSDPQVKVVK
jgi:hypothetical protein